MKRMLINAADPEESRIAVVENGVLQELHVELASREAYLGNIYKGRVVNIEPSIGAAFVSFGGRVNGFLHVSDILPAYGKPDFQLTDVVEGKARLTGDEGPESVQAALDDDDDDNGGNGGGGGEPAGGQAGEAGDAADDAEGEGRGRRGRRRRRRGGQRSGGDGVAVPTDGDGFDERELDEPVAGNEPDDARGQDEPDEPDEPDDFGDLPPDDDDGDDDADGDTAEGGDEDDDEEDDDERPYAMAAAPGDGRVGEAGDGSGQKPGDGAGAPDDRPRAPLAAGDDDDDADDDGDDHGGADARDDRDAEDDVGAGGEPAEGAEVAAVRSRRQGRRERQPNRDERRRSRPTIDQLLKKGQEVVVQITKEGIGSKGPTLTSYVSLPGRYLVLMPSLPKCGVSRKIDDARERRRLKRVVRELDETGQGGIGFIVRTAGVEKAKADLERDRDYLKKIWELVSQRLRMTRAPALLYQESDLVLKAMRDLFVPDIVEVVVDNRDVYLRIKDFAEKLMPHMADRIKLHESVTPLFHAFGIEKEVEALFQPRFDLPNGASIVIDQTEALVAIDVNSGRFKPGADLEETAYRTNLDAIPEIVRQLRLRDLGGLIIIDFIDMMAEKHRRGIERRLIEALQGDKARIKVGRISPFGMLEITRQRVGPGLKRTVFQQCPHCKGAGWSRTVQSKALGVLREIRALLNLKGYSVLQVFTAPAVNDYLVNHKRRSVLDLEEAAGKTVMFRAEASYPTDVVHYRFLTGDGQEARVAIPAGLGVKP